MKLFFKGLVCCSFLFMTASVSWGGYSQAVSFFVVDDPTSSVPGSVKLGLFDIDTEDPFRSISLEYNVGQGWSDFSGPTGNVDISPGDDGKELVSFRLNGGDDVDSSVTADLYFSPIDDEPYTSVIMHWSGGTRLTIATASDNDNVAPVPAPSALLLLVPGLLGIIGVRRRKAVA